MSRSQLACSQPSIFSLGVKPAHRGSREIWPLAQKDETKGEGSRGALFFFLSSPTPTPTRSRFALSLSGVRDLRVEKKKEEAVNSLVLSERLGSSSLLECKVVKKIEIWTKLPKSGCGGGGGGVCVCVCVCVCVWGGGGGGRGVGRTGGVHVDRVGRGAILSACSEWRFLSRQLSGNCVADWCTTGTATGKQRANHLRRAGPPADKQWKKL